ncbi:hypothetical protein ACLKA7_002637 [Drosophila subpalustris]
MTEVIEGADALRGINDETTEAVPDSGFIKFSVVGGQTSGCGEPQNALGKSDPLTAYIVRSFQHAANYTNVDPKIILLALDFLAPKQRNNGEFPEVGNLFDNANRNALGLTF